MFRTKNISYRVICPNQVSCPLRLICLDSKYVHNRKLGDNIMDSKKGAKITRWIIDIS